MRRARGHHTGQRPTWDWNRPLNRAGREDNAGGANLPAAAADRDRDLVWAQQTPDRGIGDVVRAARKGVTHDGFAAPIVVSEHGIAGEWRTDDATINLAARILLLVEQDASEAGLCTQSRSGQSRRAGSDYGYVIAVAQFACEDHAPRSRLPR